MYNGITFILYNDPNISAMTDTEMDPWNAERPRGILSKNERRYYTRKMDATGQKKRNIRAGARNHLKHSLLDMVVIADNMQDKDLDEVLPRDEFSMNKTKQDKLHPSLEDAMSSMVSIMYFYYDDPDLLAEAVSRGVYERQIKKGYSSNINVEIDIEQRDELEYLERLLDNHGPHELTYIQLGALREAGKITTEEHKEYLSQKSEDE